MVSTVRAQRIADRIRQELSEIILTQSQDPRLGGVNITDVEVDRELDFANVFVSAVEGSERSGEIIAGLIHAAGFLRSELAKRIHLRSFPRLRFHWDPTFERAEAMERLFAQVAAENQAREQGQLLDEDQDEYEEDEDEPAESEAADDNPLSGTGARKVEDEQ